MTIERYQTYLCRIRIRPEHNGNKPKPETMTLDGRVVELEAMWPMGENDRYPGEWAMGRPSWKGRALQYGPAPEDFLTWIASGDLEFIDVR